MRIVARFAAIVAIAAAVSGVTIQGTDGFGWDDQPVVVQADGPDGGFGWDLTNPAPPVSHP